MLNQIFNATSNLIFFFILSAIIGGIISFIIFSIAGFFNPIMLLSGAVILPIIILIQCKK